MRRLATLALVAVAALGCQPRSAANPLVKEAKLGVFFGGQMQDRDEIPFELDATKQTQGFRIDLARDADKSHHVHWEVDRPGTAKSGGSRVVAINDADTRAGQSRFDQAIPLKPGDPLGLWNVRVLLDGEIVIDRELTVYDAAARRRLLADGGS